MKTAALTLISVLIIVTTGCQKKETPVYPTFRPFSVAVYASATVQPDSLYEAHANTQGLLHHYKVVEGDLVTKGQPLAELKHTKTQLAVNNAKLQYALSRKQYQGDRTPLHTLQQQIHLATLKVREDSINYARQKRLWQNDIGSRLDYEQKELAFKSAQTALASLLNEYAQLENNLETALKTAQNSLSDALETQSEFSVQSTMQGKVYALYKEPGELITPQTPLALIGSRHRFIIEMRIDEVDIIKIKEGQKALLSLDAYPDTLFTTRISRIYPTKNIRNQTFLVEASFTQQPDLLYPGLAGEANVIIAHKDSALVVPKGYVSNGCVRTKGGRVPVVVGIQSLSDIEIVTGVDRKTPLYKPKDE